MVTIDIRRSKMGALQAMGRAALLGVWIAAWVIAATLGTPDEAWACDTGHCFGDVFPVPDASDVPLNANMWLFYSSVGGVDPELTLVEDDTGQVVLTTTDYTSNGSHPSDESQFMVARVQPLQSLSPSTTYRLEVSETNATCAIPTIRFTTGTNAQAAFADAYGFDGIDVSCEEERYDLCEDETLFPRYSLTLEASARATDAAAYAVYRNGVRILLDPSHEPSVRFPAAEAMGSECYEVRPMNIAGIETQGGGELCADLDAVACGDESGGDMDAGGVPDGGIDAGGVTDADVGVELGVDAGQQIDGGVGGDVGAGAGADVGAKEPKLIDRNPEATESGCAQAATSAPSGGQALLILLVVALTVGRRRRS